MRKLIVPVLLWSTLLAFAFHARAWSAHDFQWAASTSDFQKIRATVAVSPSLFKFPHPDAPAQRPLAAAVYHAQVYLINTGHPGGAVTINFALFVALCLLAGLLAAALTGRNEAAFIASALLAPFQTHFPFQADSLSWFPLSDNLCCLMFAAACLLAFVRQQWIICVLMAVGASLSKEWGFILPAMLGAAACLAVPLEARKRALWTVAACSGVVLLLVVYRKLTIPDPYGPNQLRFLTDNNFWLTRLKVDGPLEMWLSALATPGAALLGLLQVAAVAAVVIAVWRSQKQHPVALTALWCLLCPLPMLGMQLEFRLAPYLWTMAAVLLSTAVVVWLPRFYSMPSAARTSRETFAASLLPFARSRND